MNLRFCRGGLSSVHACVCGSVAVFCIRCVTRPCGSVAAFCLGSRLSFFLCQEKRDGLRYLAFLFRRVEIAFVRSRGALRLSALAGSLRVWLFLYGDLDGLPGTRRTGYEVGGAAFVRLCASTLALQVFPRGVRWGCAPQTAPKSLRLSGLSSGAGRVRECASRGEQSAFYMG